MRSKSVRILELNFERSWRGGERQTLFNMSGFRDAGMQVELLCRQGCPLEKKAQENGFKTVSFANALGALFFLIMKGGRYDVLHVQSSHILTYAILAKPFHRTKIIFTRRVDFVPRGRMTLLKYKLTDQIVAISTAIKDIVEHFCGKKVRLISSVSEEKTLNRERAQRIIEEQHVPAGTKIIGTTAALVQHKDPLTMVEAIRLLADKRSDFVFLHFGKGELEEQMRAKIKELELENEYRLMGFYENVEDVFGVLDLFVMSSEQEGLGSSVLDAFMYKVPVVSTTAGGLSDLVNEGRAISCDVKRPDMLATGMDMLLNRKELREGMMEKAYAFAKHEHSQEHITAEYLQLLRDMGKLPK
jgi:glycosyltransferase involved in cell wall biosynthesis